MMETSTYVVQNFLAATIGFLVYLVGFELTRRIGFLRNFNIPEPVSGGLAAAAVTLVIFLVFNVEIDFDLAFRDYLLVLFFAGIGLNTRLADLASGGKTLGIMLGLTVVFIILQDLVGLAGTLIFDLPRGFSVLMGSAALIGGHGTVIAWTPEIARLTGATGVSEFGIAVATLGLVLASLIGGPIAKLLIGRHSLSSDPSSKEDVVGVGFHRDESGLVTHLSLMRVLLQLHVAILLGYLLQQALSGAGLDLPLFVPCMLMAIVLGNVMPRVLGVAHDLRRTPTLAIVSDFALGAFLAMSLMALKLWTLSGLGVVLLVVLSAQTLLAVLFVLLVVFPLMGRDYFAAVISAGFAGFVLGATPTAIANMTAVTKRYGPAPLAFVILPLVAAFFVDLANTFVIRFFLAL